MASRIILSLGFHLGEGCRVLVLPLLHLGLGLLIGSYSIAHECWLLRHNPSKLGVRIRVPQGLCSLRPCLEPSLRPLLIRPSRACCSGRGNSVSHVHLGYPFRGIVYSIFLRL